MRKLGTCIVALATTLALAACGGSSHSGSGPPVNATTVANAMIAGGVPASIAFTYTAENDPNDLLGRQGGYTSKVSLQDSRLPKVTGDFSSPEGPGSTDGGAAIECYPDSSGARSRYQYLKGFSGGLIGDGYDYLSGPCVLRLDKALTPSQAAEYESAFQNATRHPVATTPTTTAPAPTAPSTTVPSSTVPSTTPTTAVPTTSATTAAPATTTVFIYECPSAGKTGNRVVEPSSYTTACATGQAYLDGLMWTGWGSPSTHATGNYWVDNCIPNCAQGQPVRYPATVTASNLSGGPTPVSR
jgi:hypothetical protein